MALGPFRKDLQNCLVLIITTILNLSPWSVPWQGNLANHQHLGTMPSCQNVSQAFSQRLLMSELGEEPPEVEGYLLRVHMEIRNSLFISPFFKMRWDWFSLCLHVLHSSPQLKSISSFDFDGFAPGQEGDPHSVQLAYALSSLATSLWENDLSALQRQGFLIWSYPIRTLYSDQVHRVTLRDTWLTSRLQLTAWHERRSVW